MGALLLGAALFGAALLGSRRGPRPFDEKRTVGGGEASQDDPRALGTRVEPKPFARAARPAFSTRSSPAAPASATPAASAAPSLALAPAVGEEGRRGGGEGAIFELRLQPDEAPANEEEPGAGEQQRRGTAVGGHGRPQHEAQRGLGGHELGHPPEVEARDEERAREGARRGRVLLHGGPA